MTTIESIVPLSTVPAFSWGSRLTIPLTWLPKIFSHLAITIASRWKLQKAGTILLAPHFMYAEINIRKHLQPWNEPKCVGANNRFSQRIEVAIFKSRMMYWHIRDAINSKRICRRRRHWFTLKWLNAGGCLYDWMPFVMGNLSRLAHSFCLFNVQWLWNSTNYLDSYRSKWLLIIDPDYGGKSGWSCRKFVEFFSNDKMTISVRFSSVFVIQSGME